MPSPPAFRIVIYETLSPSTTPEAAHYGAGLFLGYEEVPRWTASGPTADAAREKMQAFWDRERKSHEPKEGPKKGKPSPGVEAPEEVSVVADDDGEVL